MLVHPRTFLLSLILLLSATLALAAPPGASGPAGLIPRPPANKDLKVITLPPETPVSRLVIKFHEGTQLRLRGGALVALERSDRERATLAALGLTEARVNADLAVLQAAVAGEPRARGLDRLFKQEERQLAEQRAAGEAKSGRELADLDLYFAIPLPPGTTQGEVTDLVARLNALASVEVAYVDP